ncbi:MAG: FecR domain-containing protein [Burkholderiales bacterium]|nr:FecR domain-containing protein [Burkholderiales bacterium]
MNINRILGAALLLGLVSGVSAQTASNAGTVQRVTGNAVIIGTDNAQRPATARETVRSGESIRTEAGGEVLVRMVDDSSVALRQNTLFQFTEVRHERRATDSFLSNLARGSARIVSGLIGRQNPGGVRVNAATATIGIRGTDFEVAVIEEDGPQARAGVYNHVYDGRTNISLAQGPATDVQRRQTAFAPQRPNPGEEALQILRDTPIFIQQGGGLDALIQSINVPPPMIFR